jgi:hypothetical protein
MQWVEGGIAPQVVFEILSPSNRPGPMIEKFKFYEKYGVEEYYIYDPYEVILTGYLRTEGELRKIAETNGWTSPRLGIRFDLSGSEMVIYGPDGQRFMTFQEIGDERDRFARERDQIAQDRDQIAQDRDQIAQDRDQIAQDRDQIARQLEAERQRNERMAAQLRAMGLEPPP